MLKLGFMYLPPTGNIFLHLGCSTDNEMVLGALLGMGMPCCPYCQIVRSTPSVFSTGANNGSLGPLPVPGWGDSTG